MKIIEIYNYDGRTEYIRADQIESVRMPSGRVNDNGIVILLSGRQIGFGSSNSAERLIKELLALEHIYITT